MCWSVIGERPRDDSVGKNASLGDFTSKRCLGYLTLRVEMMRCAHWAISTGYFNYPSLRTPYLGSPGGPTRN